ncbi:MAG: 3'-5' exonuclease [Vibrio sp.]
MVLSLFSNKHPLSKLETERLQIIKQNDAQPEAIAHLLQSPMPNPKAHILDFPITVLDFETSGLDPLSDQIVSIGWIQIVQGVIKLNSAQHYIVQSSAQSSNTQNLQEQTYALHHILPQDQEQGVPLEWAMNQLFESMPNPIVLAHGSTIEKRFMQQYCEAQKLPNLPLIWLDTLKIEQNTSSKNNYKKDFRLFALRQFYQLPEYPAHHALTDAIATAELFLAQKHRLFNQDTAPIGVLYEYSK